MFLNGAKIPQLIYYHTVSNNDNSLNYFSLFLIIPKGWRHMPIYVTK
jgi:hypothetical protein